MRFINLFILLCETPFPCLRTLPLMYLKVDTCNSIVKRSVELYLENAKKLFAEDFVSEIRKQLVYGNCTFIITSHTTLFRCCFFMRDWGIFFFKSLLKNAFFVYDSWRNVYTSKILCFFAFKISPIFRELPFSAQTRGCCNKMY